MPAEPETHGLLARAEELERTGDPAAAELAYAEVFRSAWRARQPQHLAVALRKQAHLRCRRGAHEDARDLAVLAFEIADRMGQEGELAWAENQLAVIFHHMQRWGEARRHYQRALARAREGGDDALVGFTCLNLGVVAQMRGNLGEARPLYLESIAASTRAGESVSAAFGYNNLGLLARDRREWLDARLFFERGIEIAQRVGHENLEALMQANRAEPLIHMGELAEARASLERAAELAARTGNARAATDACRLRGVVARLEGDLAGAERHVMRALAGAESAQLRLELAEGLEELGRIRLAQGRTPLALSAVRQARDTFRELGARLYAERAGDLAEEIEAGLGRPTTPAGPPP